LIAPHSLLAANSINVRIVSRSAKSKENVYVGHPYSRAKIYAARMSRGSSSYRSISAAGSQQTRRPPLLLSIDGTEGQSDGRTLDRYMTLTLYYAGRVTTV